MPNSDELSRVVIITTNDESKILAQDCPNVVNIITSKDHTPRHFNNHIHKYQNAFYVFLSKFLRLK